MAEKKHVATNYHVKCHSVFDVHAFLELVDKWINDNHFHKEIKDQSQINTPTGIEMVYRIEAWNHVHHHAHGVICLNVVFKNMKDVTPEIKGKKRILQEADVHIEVDGFLESHFAHGWANKPLYYFMRGFVHRFFYKNLYDMYDGEVAGATVSMYNTVRKFFIKKKQIP